MRRVVVTAERMLVSRALVWTVLAGGSALRVAQYVSGRSLWLDESTLALNIVDRPFSRLFGTLDYLQGAPPGFLLVERLVVDALGSSENALRLMPLVAGVASLPLFYAVARQLLGPAGAAAAFLLFAVLDGPILYSAEAKQYSGDVCLTLAVLVAVLTVTDRRLTNRDSVGLAVLGAVAVWFSHAAAFVLAGCGATLIVAALATRERRRLPRLLVITGSWLASFGVVYLVNIRDLPKELGSFFLPIPPTSAHDVVTIVRSFFDFLRGDLSLGLPAPLAVVGAGLGLVGIVSLGRRSPARLSLLLTPVAIAAVASGVARYPWGGRFTLFLVPIVPLLVVAGAEAVAGRSTVWGPLIAAVLVVAVGVPSFAAAIKHVGQPRRHEEMAPVIRTLDARYRRGDTIYINHAAQFAVRYYAVERHLGGRLPIVRARGAGTAREALRSIPPAFIVGTNDVDVNALPRAARVWVLLCHKVDRAAFVKALDRTGRRLLTETHPGVLLALYDLEPEP